jgi:hypothetical protein
LLRSDHVVPVPEYTSDDPIKIQTVYGKADIARGYAMGYWPDVRIIRPDPKMNSKITVGQHPVTGEVKYSHDYRKSFREYEDDEEDIEYDEDGVAWWFDNEAEVWYFFDEDADDWFEWDESEYYEFEEEVVA